jgi:hypothetical protein
VSIDCPELSRKLNELIGGNRNMTLSEAANRGCRRGNLVSMAACALFNALYSDPVHCEKAQVNGGRRRRRKKRNP